MIAEKTEDQLVADARRYYDERLKELLEPEQNGAFVVIDVEHGVHAVDRRVDVAHRRAAEQGATGCVVCLRVGHDVVFDFTRVGSSSERAAGSGVPVWPHSGSGGGAWSSPA